MHYDKDFKIQAIQLSDDIGVRNVAEQLGIPYYTLADLLSQRAHCGIDSFTGSGHEQMKYSRIHRILMDFLWQHTGDFGKKNNMLYRILGVYRLN